MALTPSTMLPLGTTAPDFSLPSTEGLDVTLSDCRGEPTALGSLWRDRTIVLVFVSHFG